MTELYNPATGYNRAAIMHAALAMHRAGRFDNWTAISKRARFGQALKAVWLQARREKERYEYLAYQAELSAKIAAAEARAAAYVPSNEAPRQQTADERIAEIYRMAGTLD